VASHKKNAEGMGPAEEASALNDQLGWRQVIERMSYSLNSTAVKFC
jgi:hypothetical protein